VENEARIRTGEGTYTDLILVEGNPLENICLIEDPENNFKSIIKDRKIYNNTLMPHQN